MLVLNVKDVAIAALKAHDEGRLGYQIQHKNLHTRRDGSPLYSPGGKYRYPYKNDQGLQHCCAIGASIDDEHYTSRFEATTLEGIIDRKFPGPDIGISPDSISELSRLQAMHDSAVNFTFCRDEHIRKMAESQVEEFLIYARELAGQEGEAA